MAVIEHADPNVSMARVNVGSQLQTMSDAAVLDLFNAMMDAQEDLAAEFDSTAVEIPPGKPQVRFVEDSAQWVPRGRVLRCHIEDDENGETVIYIDDRAFDLTEFGGLLRFFGELSRPLDSQTTRGEDMTTSDLPEVSESPQEAAHSSLDQVCSECGAPIRQNLASSTAERHDPEVRQPENNVSPAQRRRMTQGHRITGEIQYSSYQEREDIYRAAYQACGWDPVI